MRKIQVGVICHSPSIQMSAQYDALSELEDYEFHILFRHDTQGNSAWMPQFPAKVKYDLLPCCKVVNFNSKLKNFLNSNIWPVLNKYNFDVMILHGIYDSSAVWQAISWCRRNNKPYLLRTDANVNKERRFFRRMIRKVLIGNKVRLAAGILHIGTQNRKYYKLFGAVESQFFLAPWEIDYVDLEQYHQNATKKRQTIRKRLGLEDDDCVIITVGRLIHLKGYDTFISALSRFPKENTNVKFVIVGEGTYRKKIEELLRDNKLSATFCGSLDRKEMIDAMTASDIFVIPSYREAWGLVVNEAALAGLPIISSEIVGASKDLIVNNLNGYTYSPHDSSELYAHLNKLVLDKNLREKMGDESKKIIENWRVKSSALEGYKKALESVVKNAEK